MNSLLWRLWRLENTFLNSTICSAAAKILTNARLSVSTPSSVTRQSSLDWHGDFWLSRAEELAFISCQSGDTFNSR